MSDKEEFPFFTRVVPPKTVQAEAWATLADLEGWDWVGLLATVQPVHSATASAFQQTFNQLRPNGTIISDVFLDTELTREDARATLLRLREQRVRVFFVSCYVAPATVLLSVAAELGMLSDRFVWIGSDSWATFAGTLPPGSLDAAVVATEFGVPDDLAVPFFGELAERAPAAAAARRIWTMTGYDATLLVARTLEAAAAGRPSLPDRGPNLLNVLYRTASDTIGVTGALALNLQGDRRGFTAFHSWYTDALGVRRLRKVATVDAAAPGAAAGVDWPWASAPDAATLGRPPRDEDVTASIDTLVSIVLPLAALLVGAVAAWILWAERSRNRMLALVRGATYPSSAARIFATGCEFVLDSRLAASRVSVESPGLKAGTDLPLLAFPPQLPAVDATAVPRRGSAGGRCPSTVSSVSTADPASLDDSPSSASASSSHSANSSLSLSLPASSSHSGSSSSASSSHLWDAADSTSTVKTTKRERVRGLGRRRGRGTATADAVSLRERERERERDRESKGEAGGGEKVECLTPLLFSATGAAVHDGVLEVVWTTGGVAEDDFVLVWSDDVPVCRVGPSVGAQSGVLRVEGGIARPTTELTLQSWQCGKLAASEKVCLARWAEAAAQRLVLGTTVLHVTWHPLAPYPVDVARHEALRLRRVPLDVPCRIQLRLRNNSTTMQAVSWPPTRRQIDYSLSPSTVAAVAVVGPGETALLEGSLSVHASGLYALTIGILVHQLGTRETTGREGIVTVEGDVGGGAVHVAQLFVPLQFVTEATHRIASHCVEFGMWDDTVRSVALTSDVDLHREVDLWRTASADLDPTKLAPLLGYVLDVGVAALLVRSHQEALSLGALDTLLALSTPKLRRAVASALSVARVLREVRLVHGGFGLLTSWSIDEATGSLCLLDIRDRTTLNFERCLTDPLAFAPELVFASRADMFAPAVLEEPIDAPPGPPSHHASPARLGHDLLQSPSVSDLRAALTGPRKMSATLRDGDAASMHSLVGSFHDSPLRDHSFAELDANAASDAWGVATLLWRLTATQGERVAWSAREATFPWTICERLLAGQRPALPSLLAHASGADAQWSDAVASRIQRWWSAIPRMREPLP
jgi:hypothetical protein